MSVGVVSPGYHSALQRSGPLVNWAGPFVTWVGAVLMVVGCAGGESLGREEACALLCAQAGSLCESESLVLDTAACQADCSAQPVSGGILQNCADTASCRTALACAGHEPGGAAASDAGTGQAQQQSCGGVPRTCFVQDDPLDCGRVRGCSWRSGTETCRGSAMPCASFTVETCALQLGCSLR